MVLIKITERAKAIPGFNKLPITSQVSLLKSEILEARMHRVPHKAICSALQDGGSTVSVRYFRQVLFELGLTSRNTDRPSGDDLPLVKSEASRLSTFVGDDQEPNLTATERRQQKAEFYTSSNNPLLHQLKKTQE